MNISNMQRILGIPATVANTRVPPGNVDFDWFVRTFRLWRYISVPDIIHGLRPTTTLALPAAEIQRCDLAKLYHTRYAESFTAMSQLAKDNLRIRIGGRRILSRCGMRNDVHRPDMMRCVAIVSAKNRRCMKRGKPNAFGFLCCHHK